MWNHGLPALAIQHRFCVDEREKGLITSEALTGGSGTLLWTLNMFFYFPVSSVKWECKHLPPLWGASGQCKRRYHLRANNWKTILTDFPVSKNSTRACFLQETRALQHKQHLHPCSSSLHLPSLQPCSQSVPQAAPPMPFAWRTTHVSASHFTMGMGSHAQVSSLLAQPATRKKVVYSCTCTWTQLPSSIKLWLANLKTSTVQQAEQN